MKNNFIFKINERYRDTKEGSDIDVHKYSNKLYIDPLYGRANEKSVINYAVLSGKWDIEDIREDNSIVITHRSSGDTIMLSFKSFGDKVAFAKILYSNKPVKQVGVGFNLESFINKNILNE